MLAAMIRNTKLIKKRKSNPKSLQEEII